MRSKLICNRCATSTHFDTLGGLVDHQRKRHRKIKNNRRPNKCLSTLRTSSDQATPTQPIISNCIGEHNVRESVRKSTREAVNPENSLIEDMSEDWIRFYGKFEAHIV